MSWEKEAARFCLQAISVSDRHQFAGQWVVVGLEGILIHGRGLGEVMQLEKSLPKLGSERRLVTRLPKDPRVPLDPTKTSFI